VRSGSFRSPSASIPGTKRPYTAASASGIQQRTGHLKELAGQAGIEKRVTFHLSRNAAAWKLYQNVGDIYKVSKFLGHSNVEQTQDYIDGFVDESRDDFIAAMT
jgi:integrase